MTSYDFETSPKLQGYPALPTVAAVVVTRNRVPMLRETLRSLQKSKYPITQFIVSDDSSNSETAEMLAMEFPEVTRIAGPRRGISSNRNRGVSLVTTDYVLLSDDDMDMDPRFIEFAMDEVRRSQPGMIFTGITNHGEVIFPNTISFLGFSSRRYKPGAPYNTANQQSFLLATKLAKELPYDEAIEAYGYEEVDFAYRVAASGARIHCVQGCSNIHLAPDANQTFRPEQDACRLYVGFKRFAYVDRRPFQALAFLAAAIPHHLFHAVRRDGLKGLRYAFVNFKLAFKMLQKHRQSLR